MVRRLRMSLALLLLIASCSSSVNHNAIRLRISSPDGRWDAIVFTRDYGATTRADTHVSVVKRGAGLPDEAGNVFIIDGAAATVVKIKWDDDSRLRIAYDKEYVVEYALHDFHGLIVFISHIPPGE